MVALGCKREMPHPSDTLAQHAPIPTVPDVPAERWRDEIREAYRLRPDSRFLMALGEVDRLARGTPGPPGGMAEARFVEGEWRLSAAGEELGRLPELPEFANYFALLVARAAKVPPPKGGAPASSEASVVLLPGLGKTLESVDARWNEPEGFLEAARAFAWVAFQRPDRQDVAPLLPARGLALLAAARARDPRAGLEEEILLAHALGYTRHAETRARSLPPASPLRLFETLEFDQLWSAASKPGASEETRFLALASTASSGDYARWRDARNRFFPGNTSASVIGTGLVLKLPGQVEEGVAEFNLRDALPRAVLRELAEPTFVPATTESLEEFDQRIAAAVAARRGFLWDGAAVRASAEAAFYAPVDMDSWNAWPETGMGGRLARLAGDTGLEPAAKTGAVGGPLMIQRTTKRLSRSDQNEYVSSSEIRRLAAALDSRPASRAALADLSATYLDDPLAAERLHRSLLLAVGDFDAARRAQSALYVGDWDTVRRLVRAPTTTAPVAVEILWAWYRSRLEKDALDAEFARLVERYPADWDVTSSYVSLLRDLKRYDRACAIGEQWLARNRNARQAGQFHAHIRLAHSYVLAGQYGKGMALLQGMTESDWFQRAIIERGLAECLMGMGRLPEAETKLRTALASTPQEPEVLRDLVVVLWRQGRNDDAAKFLAESTRVLSSWDLSQALEVDFAGVFVDAPADRRSAAVAALAGQGPLRRYATWLPLGFVDAGRPDLAFEVAAQLAASAAQNEDLLIAAYSYLEKAKGHEAAGEWLRGRVPPARRNPMSMKALYTGNDGLLWDLIETPDANDHPEWVWLFRACALALRPADNAPHRAAVLAYYERPDPDRYHRFGRYVVGLSDEQDLSKVENSARMRAEPAYYRGVRAESEGRIREACEWYRVAWETPTATSPRTLAIMRLREWSGSHQGIWRVEKERAEGKAPAKRAG